VDFLKRLALPVAGNHRPLASVSGRSRQVPEAAQKKQAAQVSKDNPLFSLGAAECRTMRENMSEKWIHVPVLGQTPCILTVRQGLPHDLRVLG
jgi:hypothetical protein